ncbi:MAG: hypothetical protein IT369_11460 [Candidatus Latescibacteria bacterium]|nr:hypothetical protein [Candidatus Latescibacterota bacterium]
MYLHIGNDLNGSLARWTVRHLNSCKGCASEYQALLSVRKVVQRIAAAETPQRPVDLAAQVRKRIAVSSGAKLLWPWRQPVLGWPVAAALLVVVGTGMWWKTLDDTHSTILVAPVARSDTDAPGPARPGHAIEGQELSYEQRLFLLNKLNPNRKLSDRELALKYPTVKSISYPTGTLVAVKVDDPNIKIIWIIPKGETP